MAHSQVLPYLLGLSQDLPKNHVVSWQEDLRQETVEDPKRVQ